MELRGDKFVQCLLPRHLAMQTLVIACLLILCISISQASIKPAQAEKTYTAKPSNEDLETVKAEALEAFKHGIDYLDQKDLERGIDWMTQAANLGHTKAQAVLSIIYSKEKKYQNTIEAYKWAFILMLHTGSTKLLEYTIMWLSLDDLDIVNKKIILWLDNRAVKKEVIFKVKRSMKKINNVVEQEDFASSSLKTLGIDKSWIVFPAIITQ